MRSTPKEILEAVRLAVGLAWPCRYCGEGFPSAEDHMAHQRRCTKAPHRFPLVTDEIAETFAKKPDRTLPSNGVAAIMWARETSEPMVTPEVETNEERESQ